MNAYDKFSMKSDAFACFNKDNSLFLSQKNQKLLWHSFLHDYVADTEYKYCVNNVNYNYCYDKMVNDGYIVSKKEFFNDVELDNYWISNGQLR